jgi:hypothetical protein
MPFPTTPAPVNGQLHTNKQGNTFIYQDGGWVLLTAGSGLAGGDYSMAIKTTSQTIPANTVADILFQNVTGNIPFNAATGVWTLNAGVTYELEAALGSIATDASTVGYRFVDAVTNIALPTSTDPFGLPVTNTTAFVSNPTVKCIYTPTSNQTIKLRHSQRNVETQYFGSASNSYVSITQLGQRAVGSFTPATAGVAGLAGFVPAPQAGKHKHALRGGSTEFDFLLDNVSTGSSGVMDLGNTRIQWGSVSLGQSAPQLFNLNAPFSGTNYRVFAGTTTGGTGSTNQINSYAEPSSSTQFLAFQNYQQTSSSNVLPNVGAAFPWFAIGQKP